MSTFDVVFYGFFALVVGTMLFRFIKFGGIRGIMYGARIARTVGEIDLGSAGGASSKLRVHTLENGKVVIEQASRSTLGGGMQGITVSREHLSHLISLLQKAGNS